MAAPPTDAIDVAIGETAKIARTGLLLTILSGLVALASVVVLAAGFLPAVLLLGAAAIYAVLYGVSHHRAVVARNVLRTGPYLHVRAAGWYRSTDGAHYGLYFTEGTSEPDHVLRLPMKRDVEAEVDGWLAGSLEPSSRGGVALFDETGLRATGRILDSSEGRKRWYRRREPTGIWGKVTAARRQD